MLICQINDEKSLGVVLFGEYLAAHEKGIIVFIGSNG